MSIFSEPFFSVAGQKERLSNVVQTVKAAVTLQGVKANTPSATANKILSTAASNPYATAAVVATAAAPKAALSVAKSIGSTVGTAIKETSAATKVKAGVAAVLAAPIGISILKENPTAPSQLVSEYVKTTSNIGKNIGKATANPSVSSVYNIFKENPKSTIGAVVAGGAAIVGSGLVSNLLLAQNTRATASNTMATMENTFPSQDSSGPVSGPVLDSTNAVLIPTKQSKALVPAATPAAITPVSSNIAPVKAGTVAKKRKGYKKQSFISPIRNQIYNNIVIRAG